MRTKTHASPLEDFLGMTGLKPTGTGVSCADEQGAGAAFKQNHPNPNDQLGGSRMNPSSLCDSAGSCPFSLAAGQPSCCCHPGLGILSTSLPPFRGSWAVPCD